LEGREIAKSEVRLAIVFCSSKSAGVIPDLLLHGKRRAPLYPQHVGMVRRNIQNVPPDTKAGVVKAPHQGAADNASLTPQCLVKLVSVAKLAPNVKDRLLARAAL
jgi:hypothetical protein